MTTYILNYLLCTMILYLPYRFWIANTNVHYFKRYYLIIILILPIIIPFVEYNTYQPINSEIIQALPNTYNALAESSNTKTSLVVESTKTFNWTNLLIYTYAIIILILTCRFCLNINKIIMIIQRNTSIIFNGNLITLTENQQAPFSFLNRIFVNRIDFEKGIHPTIWKHEETHIQQKHSIDILLIEVLRIFFWFNPLLFFIKKDIQLNHEYLADQAVILDKTYIEPYCYLLLNLSQEDTTPILSSQLNYKQIKNRLMMMTKKTSLSKKTITSVIVIICLFGSTILFAKKNVLTTEAVEIQNDRVVTDTVNQAGAPTNLLLEYDNVIRSITTIKKKNDGSTYTSRNLKNVNINRMAYIASLMNSEQIKERTDAHGFNPPKIWPVLTTKPKQKTPTDREFSNWENSKIYGVWIDGKKSTNAALMKLKAEDIKLYYVSKLYGKAKIGRNYTHQLDVYTQQGYDKAFAN